MEGRFSQELALMRAEMTAKVDQVTAEMTAKVDQVTAEMTAKVDQVTAQVGHLSNQMNEMRQMFNNIGHQLMTFGTQAQQQQYHQQNIGNSEGVGGQIVTRKRQSQRESASSAQPRSQLLSTSMMTTSAGGGGGFISSKKARRGDTTSRGVPESEQYASPMMTSSLYGGLFTSANNNSQQNHHRPSIISSNASVNQPANTNLLFRRMPMAEIQNSAGFEGPIVAQRQQQSASSALPPSHLLSTSANCGDLHSSTVGGAYHHNYNPYHHRPYTTLRPPSSAEQHQKFSTLSPMAFSSAAGTSGPNQQVFIYVFPSNYHPYYPHYQPMEHLMLPPPPPINVSANGTLPAQQQQGASVHDNDPTNQLAAFRRHD